jgi:hypothetical protein
MICLDQQAKGSPNAHNQLALGTLAIPIRSNVVT